MTQSAATCEGQARGLEDEIHVFPSVNSILTQTTWRTHSHNNTHSNYHLFIVTRDLL